MLEMTDNAQKELDAYFADKEKSPIRIFLAPGGCSGPRLALALDEPNDKDDVFENSGYTFCVEKALTAEASFMKLDMTHMGFTVDSDLPIQSGGGCSCSSGCDSGGCGC